MSVKFTFKSEEGPIKMTEKKLRHRFTHHKSIDLLLAIPTILHTKFDSDWSTGLRDILVSSCNHMGN